MEEQQPKPNTSGFGFIDASEYEPKEDSTAWFIKNILPKDSFGFVAGPPKGGASPHGGKSVLQRKLGLCFIEGQTFLGHEVLETGKILYVNLDEDVDKQVRLYYRMTGGRKVPGYLISRANSCKLPDQIKLLEEDIKNSGVKIVLIDPLQRTLGTKAVKNQEDVGPIINELKRLSKQYHCTIIVSHHSNKSDDRNKDTTASWLNGSVDLDAAWDFCLCLEYHKKRNVMYLRNFQKEKAKTDIFYEAEIVNKDEIIDLHVIQPGMEDFPQARQIFRYVLKNGVQSYRKIEADLGIGISSISYQVQHCSVLKNLMFPDPKTTNFSLDETSVQ